jgi:AraC-like DNA-binding protein
MVWNTLAEDIDAVPRPLVALGNLYPNGHTIPPHHHRRHQLLYGASGSLMVDTADGTWVVPPQRGMWIPSGITHEVRMLGDVRTRSLFVEPEAAIGMPDRCQVVSISPFMRNLLLEAIDLPVEYDPDSRAGALMTLLLHEMRQLPVVPLSLPFPAHGPLAEYCRRFLRHPTPHETIDTWSDAVGMSRRAFTRLFRRETGLSFGMWRQQACLFAALPRLVAGEPVTTIAIDLGYDNPAAFTAMFKRILGASPRNYFKQASEGAP